MIAHIMRLTSAKVKAPQMPNSLTRLFQFKAWADDALFAELAKVGERASVTDLAIKALSHAYIVDRIFAAHLRGEQHVYRSANLEDMPSLEQLSRDMRASDQEYVAYVAKLGTRELAEKVDFAFTDGAPGRMSREEMLLHVITHGVGHRGQVSALLLLNGLPNAADGFTTYLHQAEPAARRRAA
jgi:uncharacterized damage-inducible protein DinB